MHRSGSFLPPYLSTRTMTFYLSALLLITAASFSVSAGFEISEVRLLVGLMSDASVNPVDRYVHSLIRDSLSTARGCLFAVTAVVFSLWLYRSRINGRAFGARRFEYPRKWALLGFVVPVLNLIRPLQVVSEVWRVSDPTAIDNPFDWKIVPVPRTLAVWWWMMLGCGCVALIGLALTTTSGLTLGQLTVARGISIVGYLGATVSTVLGYLIVTHISSAQDRKWELLSGEPIRAETAFQGDGIGDPAIAALL